MQMRVASISFFFVAAISREGKNVKRSEYARIQFWTRRRRRRRSGSPIKCQTEAAARCASGREKKKKRRGWDETRRTKRKGREVDKTDNVHERDKARRVYAR